MPYLVDLELPQPSPKLHEAVAAAAVASLELRARARQYSGKNVFVNEPSDPWRHQAAAIAIAWSPIRRTPRWSAAENARAPLRIAASMPALMTKPLTKTFLAK
jgi:hypothetical protein